MIDDYEIVGYTDSSALSFLATWVAVNQPKKVLQLGTWIGFSTLVLADILRGNILRGKLVTVDPAKTQQDKARIYVHEAGLSDTVQFIDGRSFDAAVVNSLSAMRPFDLIYVDASHEYRQTLKELTLYLGDGWLSKSGAMFLHDASDYARQFDPTGEGGVRRALDECVRGSLILEPPQWANLCGLAIILSRRTRARTEVAKLRQKIQSLEGSLTERNLRIRSFEQWLSERDSRIQSLEGSVVERDLRIRSFEQWLSERDSRIQSLEGSVVERDSRIQSLEGSVVERDSRIQSLEGSVVERDLRIRSFEQWLSERDSKIQSLEKLLAHRDSRIQELNGQLDAIRTSITWRLARYILERTPKPLVEAGLFLTRRLIQESRPRTEKDIVASQAAVPKTLILHEGPLEADHGPTRIYRSDNLREQLLRLGVSAEVRHVSNFSNVPDATEILVLQRVAFLRGHTERRKLVQGARVKGKLVLADFDDYVFDPNFDYKRWVWGLSVLTKEQLDNYMPGVIGYHEMLRDCTAAIFATPFLAASAERIGLRSLVHRNSLNERYIRSSLQAMTMRPSRSRITVGYVSGTRTHDADFREAEDALIRVLQRHPELELRIFGLLELGPKFDPVKDQVKQVGPTSYYDMPKIISEFDINIAPLEQGNPYCQGKSEVKYLESAAVAVPTIASRSDSYIFAIANGSNGLLAGSTQEWFENLETLISNHQIRRRMGMRARNDAILNYSSEESAKRLEAILAMAKLQDPPHNVSLGSKSLKIGFVTSEPFPGSGGHQSIIKLCKLLSSMGHHVTLYAWNTKKTNNELQNIISKHYLAENIGIRRVEEAYGDDALIATWWETAYVVYRNASCRKRFYLVQDFEPWFYQLGTTWLKAEYTYKLPLSCITTGPWLASYLRENYSADAEYINFPMDHSIYQSKLSLESRRKQILFHAQPSKPRRAYELGLEALEVVHERMPDAEIVMFGEEGLQHRETRFPAVKLGLVSTLKELANLYNESSVGLSFSTSNMSLVPLEMMACGCAVVGLDTFSAKGTLQDGLNCLLADFDPHLIAEKIIQLLSDRDLRIRIAEGGIKSVENRSWESTAKEFEVIITRKVAQG
jgi:glycosyltransferase involved in cell wall biosynthesis/predicted O-methyltransferase YrrM